MNGPREIGRLEDPRLELHFRLTAPGRRWRVSAGGPRPEQAPFATPLELVRRLEDRGRVAPAPG